MLQETHRERKKLASAIRISGAMVLLFVIAHLLQYTAASHFYTYGIKPREISGLPGILFGPLLHEGWDHLINNMWSFFIMMALAIYSYSNLAYRVFFITWAFSGLGIWIFGRDSYHFGASGVVYGMAGFLFISGLIRHNASLRALSIIVVVLHWGFLWGMNPGNISVSWEGHLSGFLAGAACSIYYVHQGPPDDVHPAWMEEADEPETGEEYWNADAEKEKP